MGGRDFYLVLLVTPLVIGPMVIGGVYLGMYLGDVFGVSRDVLAIAVSTAGFLLGIVILVRLIRAIVARGAEPNPRPSSAPLP